MTPEQFCYWLQGRAELDETPPTPEQWKSIREHLATVFVKVTPPLKPYTPKRPLEPYIPNTPSKPYDDCKPIYPPKWPDTFPNPSWPPTITCDTTPPRITEFIC